MDECDISGCVFGDITTHDGRRVCSRCGWKGECHRHRMTSGAEGGKYTRGNVVALCPNCHCAAHDKGDWNKPQT